MSYLFVSDRKIDMIISGGVNIYPAEIEGVLVTHPAVVDAAVFGVPNPEFGEEVKAAVEVAAGAEPNQALAAELDPQRPLSEEGRAAVAKLAGYLAALGTQLLDPPITEVRHSGSCVRNRRPRSMPGRSAHR